MNKKVLVIIIILVIISLIAIFALNASDQDFDGLFAMDVPCENIK